ncbi:MAG: formylglycine-generating enzyme family protein [Planctomycetota bacterium]|jgi:formylglycine-generating enzyme required for sulfatase activity|nr:formylglycine-generating enzyme family protein [Blastopirellula sp.]
MLLRLMLITAILATCLSSTESVSAQADKEITNSIGMKLVLIPRGKFAMGSARGNPEADADERQHEVTLTRDCYLGAFEVTQSQFEKVMGRNPSQFQGPSIEDGGANHPVDQVSWFDAVEFCKRLSELTEERAAGRTYRLPSEAEWEYACRAGSSDEFAFGNDVGLLGDYAWYEENSVGLQRYPVGRKKPNAWGLYDMHGNAWEWCADWYEEYSGQPAIDPTGPSKGADRVYRGGSISRGAPYCRSANRTATNPSFAGFVSFRVAMNALTDK